MVGKCFLKIVSRIDFITPKEFTCYEVKKKLEEWKKEFRENNGTDFLHAQGRRDKVYDTFCRKLDDFLDQCKCEHPWSE